ncbi:hypothetical protein PINS_up007229 [Pythium insidiosum]|nr:hypothetical protein PINS_up007229 [Pythium insidiosum]
MPVIGIDFGNADCVIGQALGGSSGPLKRSGIDIILNENSNRKNPYVALCMQSPPSVCLFVCQEGRQAGERSVLVI